MNNYEVACNALCKFDSVVLADLLYNDTYWWNPVCEIMQQANDLVRECRANADALDAFEENAANNGYRIR